MAENKNILWVEDEYESLLGLIKPLLKSGYSVDCVVDENQAMDQIKKHSYDLIIIDLILPSGIKYLNYSRKLIGIDIITKLKLELDMQTPILVVTVVNDPGIIQGLLDLGVKNVLFKGALLPSVLKEEVIRILEK